MTSLVRMAQPLQRHRSAWKWPATHTSGPWRVGVETRWLAVVGRCALKQSRRSLGPPGSHNEGCSTKSAAAIPSILRRISTAAPSRSPPCCRPLLPFLLLQRLHIRHCRAHATQQLPATTWRGGGGGPEAPDIAQPPELTMTSCASWCRTGVRFPHLTNRRWVSPAVVCGTPILPDGPRSHPSAKRGP